MSDVNLLLIRVFWQTDLRSIACLVDEDKPWRWSFLSSDQLKYCSRVHLISLTAWYRTSNSWCAEANMMVSVLHWWCSVYWGFSSSAWQAMCYEEMFYFVFLSVPSRDDFCIERAWTLLCNGNLFMRFCCVQVCQPCYCKHSRIVTQIRAWILLQIEWSGEIASLYWYKLMLPVVSDNTCTLEQKLGASWEAKCCFSLVLSDVLR